MELRFEGLMCPKGHADLLLSEWLLFSEDTGSLPAFLINYFLTLRGRYFISSLGLEAPEAKLSQWSCGGCDWIAVF